MKNIKNKIDTFELEVMTREEQISVNGGREGDLLDFIGFHVGWNIGAIAFGLRKIF